MEYLGEPLSGPTLLWSLAPIEAFVALEISVVDIRVNPLPHALEGILVTVACLWPSHSAGMGVVGRGVQIEPAIQPTIRIDIDRILQQLAIGHDTRGTGIGVGDTNLIVRVRLGYRDVILERDPGFEKLGVVMLRVHPGSRLQVVFGVEGIKSVPR